MVRSLRAEERPEPRHWARYLHSAICITSISLPPFYASSFLAAPKGA
ncbi:hypothetical protein BACCAP_01667 [Pseudoflavonifractor capillosus ATCC 29799]|uniref:Uncharacterized protein n=1 Tax=Pseudoflavonifractor capillosus ATCC 29799 TaxID=411467 RepID=A6NTY8_9FIRM|nr:hypothetical protein BACCAP_01667 [Pseudoflavonifractor capillosus ATCC 29799]